MFSTTLSRGMSPLAFNLVINFLFFISWCASAVGAEDRSSIAIIRELLSQGQYDLALKRSQEMRFNWEGDAEYDYYYGRIAFESGQFNEALFAFERVLTVQPNQHRARLELARAYFSLGDIDRADLELQTVLDVDPPQAVKDNIGLFQQQIARYRRQRKGQWSPRINFDASHDSNINSATANESIDIPFFGQLTLSDDARELEDNVQFFTTGLSWLKPFSKKQSLMADVQISQKHHQEFDRFDQGTASIVFAHRYQSTHDQLNSALRYQSTTLDHEGFQTSSSLTFGWQHWRANSWLLGANILLSDIRFPDDPFRDVSQALAAFLLGDKEGRVQNTFTLLYGDESTRFDDFPHNAKQFGGLMYQGAMPINAKHRINWQLFGQQVEYKGPHPMSILGEAREDTTAQLSLAWDWQFKSTIQLNFKGEYSKNNSNLGLFDYDRTAVHIGASYAFQ